MDVSAPPLPTPADFAAPPTAADLAAGPRLTARPGRTGSPASGHGSTGHEVQAYFGVRRENTRYLTGFVLGEGEEKVAGHSGQFLVGADEVVVLADSRYTIQAGREATGARIEDAGYDLPGAWPSPRRRRSGRSASPSRRASCRTRLWRRLEAAAPDVELVPVEGWIEADRAIKEPAELERIAAACAVADRALAVASARRSGRASPRQELALELEWLLRTGGAEAVAFDPTCLAGPQGGPAARLAGRRAGARAGRSCCSTSAPRSPATGAT